MSMILRFLAANRERLELERYGVPEQLSYVMMTPRFRASSHVVFLLLPQGEIEPALVAKIPRLAGASASVAREVANLQAIQVSRPGGFNSIPKVITFEAYDDRHILVETALVGRPMDPPAVRRDRESCCQAMLDWLVEVQQASRCDAEGDPDWFGRLVERPLRTFAERLPLSAEEEGLLERTEELAGLLRTETMPSLPLVFEHGDLSHPNVMWLKAGGPGVVDWELADPRGLPAGDLFFFLTYVAFARHQARSTGHYLPAFQEAFFGPAAWTRPYVKAYAERLQLPPALLTPLFVLYWLRYLAGLLVRFGDAGDTAGRLGPETVVWLRANRYYALWRYAVTHTEELNW